MSAPQRDRPVVAFYDTGLGRGGAKHSLLTWIEAVRRSGRFDVLVAASGDGWFVDQLEARGIPWTRIPMPAALGRIKHGSWRNPFLTAARVVAMTGGLLASWVRASCLRCDVLILTGGRDFITLFPLVIRMRRRTATVPQTTDWGRIPTCRLMCRTVSETWAISNSVADSIRAMGIDNSKVRVLPLIFTKPQPAFDRGEVRSEWRIPAEAFVIGLAGVIREQKGQREALEVFAAAADRLPETAILVLAGAPQADRPDDVAYERALRARVSELRLDDRVRFTGWCEQVPRLMRAFDMLLVPSLDNEGVPRVILEGLEAGLPILASNLPQFREILANENAGRLIPLADRAGWEQALAEIASSPAVRRTESEKSRAAWERCYSEAVAIPALEAAIARLAGANQY